MCSKDHTAYLNAQHTAGGEKTDCECMCVFVCMCVCVCTRARAVKDPRPLPFTSTARSEVRVYTVLDRLHSWIMCSVPALGVIT